MRPFNDINKQLITLHKRGITYKDKNGYKHAKKYLLANNYYTLINGYGRYFWSNTNSYPGTSFSDITHLYEFDISIRDSFFKSTLTVEKHLRGAVAYFISEQCQKYGDIEAYMKKSFYDKDILFVRKNLWALIDKNINREENNPIKNHYNNHGGVPFWVVVNYLSFKELIEILKNKSIIQNNVARSFYTFINSHFIPYKTFGPNELMSFINNIYEVRNHCAHGKRLIGFKCNKNIRYYEPLHKELQIAPNSPKQSVYHVYLVIKCFLSTTEFAILHNSIRTRMLYLNNKVNKSVYEKVINDLGFPDQWVQNTSQLRQ